MVYGAKRCNYGGLTALQVPSVRERNTAQSRVIMGGLTALQVPSEREREIRRKAV